MGKILINSRQYRVTALIMVILMMTGGLFACSPGSYSGPMESIVIGTMANAGDTLIFVAEEQKYFADNGLNITLKTYDNGLAATNAMLAGEADLAYATEFVIVGKALQRQDLRAVAIYSKNETVSLIGRKDRGIRDVSSLKGKRIGLSRGSINEFYLGRALNLSGLQAGDVTLVDTRLTDLEDALSTGKIDAVVAGSRNLYPVIQKQGGSVLVLPLHNNQPAYGTLVGKGDWIALPSEKLKRLLKSLSAAEGYVQSNPDKALADVQKKLGYDNEYMAQVWSEYQFYLSLDKSLITAMEDEARWMIKNNITAEKTVPDFLKYISEDALKVVKPEAVSIIR